MPSARRTSLRRRSPGRWCTNRRTREGGSSSWRRIWRGTMRDARRESDVISRCSRPSPGTPSSPPRRPSKPKATERASGPPSRRSPRGIGRCCSCGIRDYRTTRSPPRPAWPAVRSARRCRARAGGWSRPTRRESQVSMSHVDDGTLHAYLDGELSAAEAQRVDAHLAQCPACRERLDVERALITRAGELLALAAPPDRELPPFRTGDVKPAPRLWWRVRLPLAWAATVALALGIGRYLGERGPALPTPAPSEEGGGRRDEVARQAAPKAAAPDTRAAVEREGRGRVERRAEPAAPSAVATLAEKKEEQTGIQGQGDSIAPVGNARWYVRQEDTAGPAAK